MQRGGQGCILLEPVPEDHHLKVLRGSRASRSAADLQHGAGGSALGCRAAAAPGGTGSSGLSREKVSLQQLNGRLASYLQQVKHLEAANQRLEHQIQEELDRKCPHELRQLDGHLKTASLLQDQIGGCLSAQAQLKLQILEAELTVFDLSERCQKECAGRACLEAELSDLRLLGEVLKAHNLPELQNLLNEQMQEMAELQVRHQQDMQVPLAKVTGGVTVEMHTAESSDLLQQVEHLRQTSAALLDRNQRESWFQTQVCMLSSSQVTFDPSARSEADRAKLEALRREVDHLTADLTQHQTVVLVLEASGQEQTESFLQQLAVLRRTADGLCRELDSVLQAAAQQAADHQALLDIKSRLEAEIQNCKKLLDGLDHEGVSHVHVNSKPAAKSVCLTTSAPTFRSNITVAAPLSRTLPAAQSGFVHHKHPALAPLVESYQRTGVLSEKMSKSIISAETVSRPSGPVEDEVHAEDHDVQSSLFAGAQISHEIPNKRAFVKAMITALVPSSTDTIQTKPETLISKQAGSPSTARGVDFRVETNKTVLCAEADINQQPCFITHETTFDLCKPTTPEVQMRETLIFTHVEPPEGSFHEKKKNPTQIMSTEAETSPETIKDVDETANIIQRPSGSSGVYGSAVQGEVCSDGALMEDTDEGIDGKSGKGIVEAEGVLSLDQSLGLSKNKPNKLTEDKNTRCDNENASSAAPENNNKLYSKTARSENLKEGMDKAEEVHDHKEVKINPVHSDDELLSTTTSEASTNLTDSGVSVRSSSSEEGSQMYLTPNDPDTCLIPTEVNNGDVDKKEEAEDTSPVMSEDRVDLAGEEASKMSTSLTDSGVGLSCSSYEEFLSPKEVHVSARETKPPSTENLKEEVHDHKEVKMNPLQSDNELVNLQSKEILVSTTSSETYKNRTDSGVALSSSSSEELQIPREAELMSPTKLDECLNPEMCPVKNSHEPEMYLRPNDRDTCLIPTEVDSEDEHRRRKKGTEEEDTSPVLSLDKRLAHVSNIKLMKDAESWSSMAVSSPENKENLKRKTRTTEVLRAEVDEMEVVNNANKVKMDPDKSNEDRVDLAGEEASKMSTSLTGSGVGLSCSSYEEFLSPKEVHVSAGETKPPSCLSPEIHQNLVETEEMSQLTDHVFYPVEVGDHITSPDLLLSPNDPESDLSPNDSDSCLSPNSEEQDEATSLTEANAHVRPVEKFILSAKEAGQSVSFSGDRTWPEGRNMKVRVSEGGGDVCFRPSERYEGSGVSLNGTKLSSRPTSQRSGLQVSSSHAGLVFGDGRSIIADREEQVGFGGLYRKREARRSRGKCARAPADEEKIEGDMMGQRNSDWQVVNLTGNTEGPRFGRVSNSGDAQVAAAGIEGRVRSASGEWKVYGGSLGRKGSGAGSDSSLSADSKEYLPAATSLPRSPPGAGRLGSGEWKLYGWRPGCMSSDSEDSAAMRLATSPPGTPGAERCGSGGSGEWRVYGESTGRMSRASSADRAGISQTISPPSSCSSYSSSCSRRRLSGADRLSSGSVVRRSSSVGSSSGRFTGTGERKPVYSSASGRKSSVGSAGWGRGGRTANSPRALSPGGTIGVTGGSSGWLSSSKAAGSGNLHSAGSNDKLSSSPGSGRTNSTGGRVISSSDRPIRSAGSRAGSSKERMSVCKMAALSMSAAGRERSQERQGRGRQPPAAAPSCPALPDLSCRGHQL